MLVYFDLDTGTYGDPDQLVLVEVNDDDREDWIEGSDRDRDEYSETHTVGAFKLPV